MSHPQDRPRGRPAARTPTARPAISYRPADVIRELVTLLRGHGLTRLYRSACTLVAVLSITHDLTVWTNGHQLTWKHADTSATWPADDTEGAAAHLAQLAGPQPQP